MQFDAFKVWIWWRKRKEEREGHVLIPVTGSFILYSSVKCWNIFGLWIKGTFAIWAVFFEETEYKMEDVGDFDCMSAS